MFNSQYILRHACITLHWSTSEGPYIAIITCKGVFLTQNFNSLAVHACIKVVLSVCVAENF